MQSFTDTEGKAWTIEINVATLKRVKGITGVDLMGVLDGDLIDRFIRDPVLLCDVIYAACKIEADENGVSDEEFGRAMAGDAIENATAALLEEIVSFYPNSRDRAALERVIKATNEGMEKARDLVETKLDSGILEQAIDEALAEAADPVKRHGHSSTDAQVSAA